MQTRKLTSANRFAEALDVVRETILESLPVDASDGQRAALARVVDELPDRLREVLARADEPAENVVHVRKRFEATGRWYEYVAIRGANSYWYVSGESHHKISYTWHQLLDWAWSGRGSDVRFTIPTGWRALEVHR